MLSPMCRSCKYFCRLLEKVPIAPIIIIIIIIIIISSSSSSSSYCSSSSSSSRVVVVVVVVVVVALNYCFSLLYRHWFDWQKSDEQGLKIL